ncbi:hypothetical protein CYMTET_15754, partial [Cymbomonas tetramitiformis]
ELDATAVHPECYKVVEKLLHKYQKEGSSARGKAKSGAPLALKDCLPLADLKNQMPKVAKELGVGEPTLEDILKAIEVPGLDPRADAAEPLLRAGAMSASELKIGSTRHPLDNDGMWSATHAPAHWRLPNPSIVFRGSVVAGTVRNVVPFGAFVDVGVKQDGLIHISQLADRHIRDPHEVRPHPTRPADNYTPHPPLSSPIHPFLAPPTPLTDSPVRRKTSFSSTW